ncbi:MAG: hypothetical protein IPO27_07485 [Bacteroidetes bacterium]|nr:hypothetical protein [Bacteroidota bacterium]
MMLLKRSMWVLCFVIISHTLQAQYSDSTKMFVAQKFLGSLAKQDFPNCLRQFNWTLAGTINQYWLKVIWESVQKQNGAYMGCYNAYTDVVGDEIIIYQECRFEVLDKQLKLVFDKDDKIAAFYFVPARSKVIYEVPTYVDLAMMSEMDVAIKHKDISLAGMFTYPLSGTNFPLVILVSGEGPCDMDESKGSNKFLKDLATGFAMNGIASVRFNKRTFQYASMNDAPQNGFTLFEDIIEDAIEAFNKGKKLPNIDTNRIAFAGHGLGAYALPAIVARTGVSGAIMIEAPAQPYEDVFFNTERYIHSLNGVSPIEEQDMSTLKEKVDSAKNVSSTSELAPYELPMDMPMSYWIYMNNYKPLEVARKLQTKWFFIHSGRNFQISERDIQLWKQTLGNKGNASFKFYDKLNYYLHWNDKPSTPDEYMQKKQVSKVAIDEMSRFVFDL